MCLRTGCAKGVLRSEMKSTIYEFGQKDIFFPFATLKSNFLFTSHFELYFSFFEFFFFFEDRRAFTDRYSFMVRYSIVTRYVKVRG